MAVLPATKTLYFPKRELWIKDGVEEYARNNSLTFAEAVWKLIERGLRAYEREKK